MNPLQFQSWLQDPHRRPAIMGVLNVTPDSFSDGGQFSDLSRAVARAEQMAAEGAAVIDVGGESTRPGSLPVPAEEQIRRVVPAIRAIRARVADVVLSVDTTRAAVADAAFEAGANLVNDISAGRDDPELLPLVARRGVPLILMHMQGTPATMQASPHYSDVTRDVSEFLRERLEAGVASGIDRARILLDPGIGFGKSVEHNLELLNRMAELRGLGQPLVVGTSRKGFIGKITGENLASGRPFGTAASVAWAVTNGASLVRVHDVGPMSQVVRMIEAIQGVRPSNSGDSVE